MFKEYFLIYLLAHTLGDFYFQTEELAELKNRKIIKLIQHSGIYLAASIVVILPVFSTEVLLSIIVASLLHGGVDLAKFLYIKYVAKSNISGRRIYIVDQVIHLFCLALVAYYMAVNNPVISTVDILDNFFKVISIERLEVLSWLTMLLFIFKPANVTIKQLLSLYKPGGQMENAKKGHKNTGEFIGALERLIILIFLSINQFSVIGLVLTAKSVARYNKIAEDKEFAEYYLLGTLLSTVIVILVFVLVH